MSYFILAVASVIAAIGVFTDTMKERVTTGGRKSVSPWGWIVFFLIIVLLVTNVAIEYQKSTESQVVAAANRSLRREIGMARLMIWNQSYSQAKLVIAFHAPGTTFSTPIQRTKEFGSLEDHGEDGRNPQAMRHYFASTERHLLFGDDSTPENISDLGYIQIEFGEAWQTVVRFKPNGLTNGKGHLNLSTDLTYQLETAGDRIILTTEYDTQVSGGLLYAVTNQKLAGVAIMRFLETSDSEGLAETIKTRWGNELKRADMYVAINEDAELWLKVPMLQNKPERNSKGLAIRWIVSGEPELFIGPPKSDDPGIVN